MRFLIVSLLAFLMSCSTPIPVRWNVHKEPAPKITIPDPEFERGDPVAGRRAFISLECVACHRVAEDAQLPAPPAAAVVLRDLQRFPSSVLAQRITSNTAPVDPSQSNRTMADYTRTITTRQLVDIVKYLRDPHSGK